MEQAYLPGTVRQRIQDQLKERKITQGELAAEIGMAESSLSRFLSEKTDKIGDEYIIKIADFLGVSTDFILGQTDFPERRNYDIGELGLSYKAAMALYTREVDTDVVNRILENPQFPEITRMISRYFKDCAVSAGAKTGSVQMGDGQTNGVFICYAPFDQPEIAVAVVIEKGNSGSALASTAVEILNAYFSDETAIGAALVPEGVLLP